MRRHVPGLAALAVAAVTAATIGLAAPAASASTWPARTLPQHVFAPYFETYDTSASPAALSRASGAKYLTFAFLQTEQAGSCTAYWDGDTTQPVAPASFGADIAAIQKSGGDVVPSFGGYSADTTSTDIADSCTSVGAIARVYENVLTTYHVSRIDLDVEADSLTNTAGINRRNEAIARVEAWASARHQPVQFVYTLPTFPTGLTASGLAVLQNAVADGARISVVNIMTFDYYLGPAQQMATDTETAGAAVVGQLRSLYPATPAARLWRMIGVTEMPGIDDFGTGETFTQADAVTVLRWARSHQIAALSFWALQRDNGACPGTQGAGSCSGISQPDWYFSHVFEPFTSARGGRR
ncbi:MAG TPA: chitinase [Streptosporangiaceae bacterium]|jgi:hypothetical protein